MAGHAAMPPGCLLHAQPMTQQSMVCLVTFETAQYAEAA